VRRVLDRVAAERGLPDAIVLDNGPAFRGRALAAWSQERGVRLGFIQPGKPVQNAYLESFNGRLRDESSTCYDVRNSGRRSRWAEEILTEIDSRWLAERKGC
jgi:transposase InsO family protein